MKKTSLIIVGILIMSILIGTAIVLLDDYILSRTHPLKYTEYVEQYSNEYFVPREIIYAVIKCESSFQSDAVSYKGAIGLMQITPDTFDWLNSKTGEELLPELLYNPAINIKYGTYFLSMLYTEFGNWNNAWAAYNAGRGRVSEWLLDERYSRDGYLTDIPYEETREYVKRVEKAAEVYKRLYFNEKERMIEE